MDVGVVVGIHVVGEEEKKKADFLFSLKKSRNKIQGEFSSTAFQLLRLSIKTNSDINTEGWRGGIMCAWDPAPTNRQTRLSESVKAGREPLYTHSSERRFLASPETPPFGGARPMSERRSIVWRASIKYENRRERRRRGGNQNAPNRSPRGQETRDKTLCPKTKEWWSEFPFFLFYGVKLSEFNLWGQNPTRPRPPTTTFPCLNALQLS